MTQFNIPVYQPGTRWDEREMKRLQSYLNQMTEQLRFTLNSLSLEDITNSIDGSIIKPGSIRDDRLYSRFLLAETAHATYATIERLTSDYIKAETIEATYARITDLNAVAGAFGSLSAELANIGSILAGNVGTGSLHTMVINSSNASIANATIKSAMIESINTDEVAIASGSGRLQIADNTIQISDENRVRVQIGKDAGGDYNLYVIDADGNLMFDASGLREAGIKEPIIRDSMISEDADISASKVLVDMDEISGTLDVLFTQTNDTISNLFTTLTATAGFVSLIISEDDANAIGDETLYSRYLSLRASMEELSMSLSEQQTTFDSEIESLTSQIANISLTANDLTLEFAKHAAYLYGDGVSEGLSAYMRSSIDGLELGRSDSLVYSQFTNESLKFMVRGLEDPAMEIVVDSNFVSRVKTRNADIQELRLGGFIFEPRQNGNLSLKRVT